MMKMMIVGRRRSGQTRAAHHHYMADVHGTAVVNFIGEAPALAPRRYVQNHVFDGTWRQPAGSDDPFAHSRDFVTQVWFDDPAQARAAMTADFYREHLQPDEDRFVDQASVAKLPVAAQEAFRVDGPRGEFKVFVAFQLAGGASVEALAQGTLDHWTAWRDVPGSGLAALTRNRVLPLPGPPSAPHVPSPVDWVDEAWLTSESAARQLADHWLALTDQADLAPLLRPQSTFVLLAREHVLFDSAV